MFYVSCNPGFEEAVAAEIKESWTWLIGLNGMPNATAYPEMTLEKGGVTVDAPLEYGLQLNFFLKTAHRILWRVAEFRVRDFPKMFEKVRQIPWTKYLETPDVEWVVSASKSRLNHEKRIEDTCREAFAKAFPGKPEGKNPVQQIFVRVHDDLCSISLDSSGEHLHKRGWGTRKGEAPLRETLAAFVLRQLIGDTPPAALSQITLVDPMCGSGTLLLEAASLWKPNFGREYPFMHWKQTPKIFKTELWKKNYRLLNEESPFKAMTGFDLDDKVLAAARENLQDLKTQTGLNPQIRFEKENLFEGTGQIDGVVWCVSNPPYGERLRVQGQGEFSYEDLLARMAQKFSAKRVGLLLPDKTMVRNLRPPEGFQKLLEVPFSNGGLDVVFLIYTASTEVPRHPPTR
jgi:putative N6-adenine-specific DNA methylase